jgi:hypothetical protein
MASRIQGKTLCVGKNKQSNISTISSTFLTFTQLNAEVADPNFRTENDAKWIGKGHEFATQVFAVSFDPAAQIEQYGSTEWTVWGWAYGLGNVVVVGSGAPYAYTITPLNQATTLELPYTSIVEQIPEGGGKSVDNAYIGCQVEEVMNEIKYGAGLATHTCKVSWVGSGLLTSPSAVTPPANTVLHEQLSGSVTATINGTDYVGNKNLLSISMGWKNNIKTEFGLYPGSGVQNGAAVRGRMFIGDRVPTLTFRALLVHNSPEYAALVAQTTGTAVITIQYDANDSVTWTWEQISYEVVKNGQEGGLVDVTVTVTPQYSASNGVLTVTANCAIGAIAQ